MKKMKKAVKHNRKMKNNKMENKSLFFKMKDADGNMLMEGDTVALLSSGIEMVDEDTFEDVTGVITKFDGDCAVVNGQKYPESDMRRVKITV